MANPHLENAMLALQKHLASNLPTGFVKSSIKWETASWAKPDNSNWGRVQTVSTTDTTYAGGWSRFEGFYAIDLFFVLPVEGSIMSDVGKALDDVTKAFTNKYFDDVSTYNCEKNTLDEDSTLIGKQIIVNFSYEGRL